MHLLRACILDVCKPMMLCFLNLVFGNFVYETEAGLKTASGNVVVKWIPRISLPKEIPQKDKLHEGYV
jgi:hypothetical protein